MIREDALQTLLGFEGAGSPVLSLYLNVDPAQRSKEECRLRAKQLLEQDGHAAAIEDVQKVEQFLKHEFDWQAKGVVIFSCAPQKFWHVVRLQVPVVDCATISDRPYIRPLNEALNAADRVGVVLADREVARYFGIYMGAVHELGAERREMLRRHKQQGPGNKLQRAADESAHVNLKQAAHEAGELFQEFGANRVILAGQDESIATLKQHLPKAWQGRVIGEIAMDTAASPTQVLAKTNEFLAGLEDQRQEELLSDLVDAANKKGATGALGLDDTLEALMDRRVMTLVTAAGFTAKGYQCENCGYLSARQSDACPVCGKPMHRVEHLVDSAIRRAFENDAHVESISAEAPAQRLKELGGIGALLRY